MITRDYLMRMVQQLAGVLARILRAKEQEQYDQAMQEAEKAYGELFGMEANLLRALDAATLAQFLGHREKIKACAALFREEGELHRLKGETDQAGAKFRRALELFLEALNFDEQDDAECRQAIKALTAVVDSERLSERYLEILQA